MWDLQHLHHNLLLLHIHHSLHIDLFLVQVHINQTNTINSHQGHKQKQIKLWIKIIQDHNLRYPKMVNNNNSKLILIMIKLIIKLILKKMLLKLQHLIKEFIIHLLIQEHMKILNQRDRIFLIISDHSKILHWIVIKSSKKNLKKNWNYWITQCQYP